MAVYYDACFYQKVVIYKNQLSNFTSFNEGLKSFVDWVKTQKIQNDLYDDSIKELKNKGLIR